MAWDSHPKSHGLGEVRRLLVDPIFHFFFSFSFIIFFFFSQSINTCGHAAEIPTNFMFGKFTKRTTKSYWHQEKGII